jgi:hypothetical protein
MVIEKKAPEIGGKTLIEVSSGPVVLRYRTPGCCKTEFRILQLGLALMTLKFSRAPLSAIGRPVLAVA